jgi:hypothetical protein
MAIKKEGTADLFDNTESNGGYFHIWQMRWQKENVLFL